MCLQMIRYESITVANSEAPHDHVMLLVREVIEDYIERMSLKN